VIEYYKHCLSFIEKRIELLTEYIDKEDFTRIKNEDISFFLGGLFYFDEENNDRTGELDSIILVPIEFSYRMLFKGTLGYLSKTYSEMKIKDVLHYLKDSRNFLLESIYKDVPVKLSTDITEKYPTALKKFDRGELKRLCEELAAQHGFSKRVELSQGKINLIINDLESMG